MVKRTGEKGIVEVGGEVGGGGVDEDRSSPVSSPSPSNTSPPHLSRSTRFFFPSPTLTTFPKKGSPSKSMQIRSPRFTRRDLEMAWVAGTRKSGESVGRKRTWKGGGGLLWTVSGLGGRDEGGGGRGFFLLTGGGGGRGGKEEGGGADRGGGRTVPPPSAVLFSFVFFLPLPFFPPHG